MTGPHADETDDAVRDVGPDSGDLLVSRSTTHESGVPPARESSRSHGDASCALDQLELVLVENVRIESNLAQLLRGLQQLSLVTRAARDAHANLGEELGRLQEQLAQGGPREFALRERTIFLERMLASVLTEHRRVIEQDDVFLARLLEEHDETLQFLALERASDRAQAEQSLAQARAERDLARIEVERVSYERDEAVAALGTQEPIDLTPLPPPVDVAAIAAIKLHKLPFPAPTSGAVRPLGGYSLSADELEEEHLGGPAPRGVR